jgi:hypothetical protein
VRGCPAPRSNTPGARTSSRSHSTAFASGSRAIPSSARRGEAGVVAHRRGRHARRSGGHDSYRGAAEPASGVSRDGAAARARTGRRGHLGALTWRDPARRPPARPPTCRRAAGRCWPAVERRAGRPLSASRHSPRSSRSPTAASASFQRRACRRCVRARGRVRARTSDHTCAAFDPPGSSRLLGPRGVVSGGGKAKTGDAACACRWSAIRGPRTRRREAAGRRAKSDPSAGCSAAGGHRPGGGRRPAGSRVSFQAALVSGAVGSATVPRRGGETGAWRRA